MAFGTLETVTDYISDVRTLLQDKIEPFRYDDPSLLVALNVALLEGRRLRPDLFIFRGDGRVPSFAVVDTQPVHMEQPFRLAFVYGTAAHALSRDQEDVQDSRATTFMGVFNDILVGVRQRPIQGGAVPAKGNA